VQNAGRAWPILWAIVEINPSGSVRAVGANVSRAKARKQLRNTIERWSDAKYRVVRYEAAAP
jgi:hypothetical protein